MSVESRKRVGLFFKSREPVLRLNMQQSNPHHAAAAHFQHYENGGHRIRPHSSPGSNFVRHSKAKKNPITNRFNGHTTRTLSHHQWHRLSGTNVLEILKLPRQF